MNGNIKLSPEDRLAIVADVRANGPHVKALAARFKVSPALVSSVIRNARDFGLLPARTPKPPKPTVPEPMRKAAAVALAQGWKAPAIAAIVGVSDVTLYNWARKYSQPTPGRGGAPRGNVVGRTCPQCSVPIDASGLREYLNSLAGMYEGPGHAPGLD